MQKELEQFRAECAKNGMTTVVDYQEMTLMVIDPITHDTEVHKLNLACATYYLI